jgi:hypothetical protein
MVFLTDEHHFAAGLPLPDRERHPATGLAGPDNDQRICTAGHHSTPNQDVKD